LTPTDPRVADDEAMAKSGLAKSGLAKAGLAKSGLAKSGLAGLVGQDAAASTLRAAVARPVHAYLFVGPPGAGKLTAAMAFAAMLLCPKGGDDGCDTCRRVLEGLHPDVFVLEREGAALSIEQAREVSRIAARSSLEGGRSVVILPDLHLAREAVPALLKTIEEPPGSTVFIGLAEFVPPELETVASRSARVDFRPLGDAQIAEVLVAEGVPTDRATVLARLAGGRLDRARLLATDPEAEGRLRSWEAVPARLDGSGATVAQLAEELVELLKRSAAPLSRRQGAEAAELADRHARESATLPGRAAQSLARAGGREMEERHRREQRRQRTDELRTGLAALAGAYRDRAVAGTLAPGRAAEAVALIDGLASDLEFNPGELLAVQALLVRLDRVTSA
jgi:DNA polymerase III subunit delta'